MAVLAAAAIASAAISAYSGSQARKAQARAAKRQAAQREKQAKRMLDQNEVNRFLIGVQGEEAAASQLTGFAKSGVDITSGSALQVLADTQAQVITNQYLSAEEAKFNADQIRAEGQALKSQARSIESNRGLQATATMFQGAANAYSSYSGGGSADT